jgi:hypothetical protein
MQIKRLCGAEYSVAVQTMILNRLSQGSADLSMQKDSTPELRDRYSPREGRSKVGA